MDLRQQKAAVLKAAQDIISKARTEGRGLTPTERASLQAKRAEVETLTNQIEEADADAELFAPFAKSSDGPVDGVSSVALSFKGVANRIVNGPDGNTPRNVKALIAAGSQTVETSETELMVVKDRPVEALLDAIPAMEVDPNFSYLRQTVRTNNAAPVARGALKPTSIFTLERKEARLKVVAHLSEPMHEYDLKDYPALKTFVQNEMVAGLAEAVTAQWLNGDGTGENLAGITTSSGIQTQAWSTDMIETARKGLGKIEVLGYNSGLYVFHPTDWMTIELTKAVANGQYLLEQSGAPVDRVRRQLWGQPVALSTNVAVGTGYVIGSGSTALFHDGVISVSWGLIADDFGKNQVRCRAEGRFEAGALKPAGVVSLDLTA